MKSKLYIIATFFVSMWATSCEHDSIFEPVDLVVSLSPSNTYKVGEPVVFEFDGYADYVSVYSGELNHEYKHKDRRAVAISDIASCKLTVAISGRNTHACRYPIIYLRISNEFAGIKGYNVPLNAANDRALIESSIDGEDEGNNETWEVLELPELPTTAHVYKTYDLKELGYLENVCLAFVWDSKEFYDPNDVAGGEPDADFSFQGTYFVNASIDVEFEGHPTKTIKANAMGFSSFNLAFDASKGYNEYSRGNLVGLGRVTDNASAYFIFKGDEPEPRMGHGVNTWLISTPTSLNPIDPDTGKNIKGFEDETIEFSHIYDKAGTYTVSFMSGVTNFVDESNQLQEMTITIVDPSMPTPPTTTTTN